MTRVVHPPKDQKAKIGLAREKTTEAYKSSQVLQVSVAIARAAPLFISIQHARSFHLIVRNVDPCSVVEVPLVPPRAHPSRPALPVSGSAAPGLTQVPSNSLPGAKQAFLVAFGVD